MLAEIDANALMIQTLETIKAAHWFPYRTGDLMASTFCRLTPDGYDIVFSGSQLMERNRQRKQRKNPTKKGVVGTNYIPFLEYGTKLSQKHKGFIGVKSLNSVMGILIDKFGTDYYSVEYHKMNGKEIPL